MKYLKRFLEGADSFNFDECLDLLDDIKSLEYIIEEAGDYYKVNYNFVFRVGVESGFHKISLSPNTARSWVESCSSSGIGFDFCGISVEVTYDYMKTRNFSSSVMRQIKSDFVGIGERYCLLLGDHLDYPGSPVGDVSLDLTKLRGEKFVVKIDLGDY